jgi:uncharacterized protein (TIGR02231 family)
MKNTREVRCFFGFGLGALLMISSGCAPAARATPPAAPIGRDNASDADSSALRSNVVVDDPNEVPVSSAIRKVTVYSDRALLSRQGAVKVATAPTVYAFRHLPGWVDEGSVRAATSAGNIVDVRVVRGYLARATDPRFVRAEAEARVVADRLLALDDELKVLDAKAKQVEDIKAFSMDRLNKEVAAGAARGAPPPPNQTGTVGVDTYAGVVEFIAKELREIAKGRRAVQAEREKLAPEALANNKRLDELRALTQLEETKVLVTVQGGPPAEAQLELTYMLPGATWESTHDVRTSDADPSSVDITSYAVVSQASGDDWDNAELTFSTQSSIAAVRIPTLEALTLGDTRATTQTMETRSASFKRAETAFKNQNRLWNKRVQSNESDQTSFEETYQANFESLQLTQSKTVQIFQSLQQRGTTSQFKALSTARVRADGRSVRVPIGHAKLKAKKAIVAAPEQSLNAAQTLEMVNDSGQALLPGNVSMYQAGAFLGVTNLDFVADGEQMALFLNVADQLKISRVLDKKHSALIKKQRTQMQLAFVVTVENLSNRPMPLQLADRVPVSEDKDITISGVKISPDVKPDSKGILHWPLTVRPKEKQRFEIQYTIEYPPTLVVEMKRNQQAAPATGQAPPSPSPAAPPAPRKSYDLKTDIEHLEQML